MPNRLLRGDTIATIILAAAALFIIALLVAIAAELFSGSYSSITRYGIGFLTGSTWNVNNNVYGALPFIYGTLLTSALAILIGLPISIGIAIFLSERLKGHSAFAYGWDIG